ncbi:unnamed protein product [Trichogramma brassicae]|uniref:Uncharacterized protein n=1 Tax=Trichogramma brassicae TaxID=86971 RepID=A0A6H5IX94_9HYME|nr:unnamed protein product [Trichogramma brassicae]
MDGFVEDFLAKNNLQNLQEKFNNFDRLFEKCSNKFLSQWPDFAPDIIRIAADRDKLSSADKKLQTKEFTYENLYDYIRGFELVESRLLRGHTLLASPPELDIFYRNRCLVPSCECGSRFCRRWQVPNLLCRLHLVSVVLASGATL